jgi:hypothetical protein
MVNEMISIIGVQGYSTNDMGCDQWWDVDQIFFTYIANLGKHNKWFT